MKRVILAAIVGGILLHAWEFASWMVTDIHKLDPHPQLANEQAFIDAMKGESRGIYFVPGSDTQDFDPESDAFAAWKEKHEKGPTGFIVYDPDGSEPMPAMMIVKGAIINVLMALVLALILWSCAVRTFLGRFAVGLGTGAFLILGSDAKQANWMPWTDSWMHGMVIDHAVGVLVLAIVLAIVVRPRAGSEPAAALD